MSNARKFTYITGAADAGAFHAEFDAALIRLRQDLGRTHPLFIDGEAVRTDELIEDRSPIDTSVLLGRFAAATAADIDRAVGVARSARASWERLGWQERTRVLRRAATLIRDRKVTLSALLSLEVGKSRFECIGEVEEAADLIDYYCQQVADANGFVKPLGQLVANERTESVGRPYGVFGVIAPFNFPFALAAGMSSAAMAAGNVVIFKPPEEAPWVSLELFEIYRAAGVPTDVFQFVSGRGEIAGEALWRHAGVDGIAFTGSHEVGMKIYHGVSTRFAKPVLMELGGKNAAVVTRSADLDKAAQGVMRSAFGLQGQKCSACSRVYVDERVEREFLDRLVAATRQITIGDPTARDTYFGPVINQAAVTRFEEAVRDVTAGGGRVLVGGTRLTEGPFARGHYVSPTIAKLPLEHPLHKRELFLPLLGVSSVHSLEQAIGEVNAVDLGLTAGIFSEDNNEVRRFFEGVEAGVVYANRQSGATTGAWPGVQSFTGWKGSGSSGKGGCGPYYVSQFVREQSRTIME